MMRNPGMTMIIAGAMLVVAGLAFVLGDKIPFLGNLPGDIRLKGKSSSFFFPVTTCLLLSVVITVIINVLIRFMRK